MHLSRALRTVAVIEAAKGALILLVGFGLLSLVHHDVQRFAEHLISHSHMNPAARYPRIFLDAASQLTDARLWLMAAGAAVSTHLFGLLKHMGSGMRGVGLNGLPL
jgi:uncharacterized membrane protein (DUF2068 family)